MIVDAGAQCGDYTLLAAKYYDVSKIYSFEPLSSNFKILEGNIISNRIENVRAFHAALGNSNGSIEINYFGNMMVNSQSGSSESVRMLTLDSLELCPSLMKVDVEGFEVDVLQGSLKTIQKYKPKIIIETHSKKLRRESLEVLLENGYYVAHYGRKIRPKTLTGEIQNIYLLPE